LTFFAGASDQREDRRKRTRKEKDKKKNEMFISSVSGVKVNLTNDFEEEVGNMRDCD
jgi:hypothetical protein